MIRSSRIVVALATTVLAVLVSAAPATAEDWLSARGGPGQNPARDFSPGNDFGRAWVSSTSSPERPDCVVAAGGRLFSIVTSQDDPALARLIAFRATDGTQLWATPEFPKYTPTCPGTDGRRVFVGSGYRATTPATYPAFTAFDASDGHQLWQHIFGPGVGYGATQGSPVADSGRVYVQAGDGSCGTIAGVVDGCTFEFDAANGSLVGRTEVSSVSGAPYAAFHPIIESAMVIGRDPRAQSGLYNIIARRLSDGSVVWQDGADSSAPVSADGVAYYVRQPGWPYDGPRVVVARDAATGNVIWTRDLAPGQYPFDLVVGPTAVHIAVGYQNGSVPGRLVTLRRTDGAQLWSTASATNGQPRGLYVLGGDVYADGQVFSSTGSRSPSTLTWAASPNAGAAYVDGSFYFWDTIDGGSLKLVALRDVTAPAVTTDAAIGTSYTTNARPTFRWSADDGAGSGLASTKLLLAAGGSGPLSPATTEWQPAAALTDGNYAWTVQVVDRVGNESQTTSRLLVVDTVAPQTFALRVPDGLRLTSLNDTKLSWEPSADVTSGIDRYEVLIDGGVLATISPTSCGPAACTSEVMAIPDGSHKWAVRAIDRAGHTTMSASRSIDVAIAPRASIVASPGVALTGQQVRLDPSSSVDDNGTIQRVEWDLDGDGAFERQTLGLTPLSTSFSVAGSRTVQARVVDAAGLATVTSSSVDVRPTPPPGEVGISVNGGDIATNDPKVTLNLVWPRLAANALVSNDGGFGAAGRATQVPLSAQIDWTLQSSGPERLPKTVYLRFKGADTNSVNYTDDIILDETKPAIARVTLAPPATRSPRLADSGYPRQAASKRVKIRVVASDKVSGISRVLVAPSKSAKKAKVITLRSRTKLGIRKLDQVISLKTGTRPKWVCVLDSAGNPSRWIAL